MSKNIDDNEIEIWKTVVSVQMHFNDLELRIRNFAILSLGATLTVAGYALQEKTTLEVLGVNVPFASVVLTIGVIVWLCFWFMDRHWYHRLLMGAVVHGIKIENTHSVSCPSLSLSETIKENSPNTIFARRVRSHDRLNAFYWVIAAVLMFFAIALVHTHFAILFLIFCLILAIIIFFVATEGVSNNEPK